MITKDTIEEHIDLIRAFGEGKLQFKFGNEWLAYTAEELRFSSPIERYRRKPEPRLFFAVDYGTEIGDPQVNRELAEERMKRAAACGGNPRGIVTLREVLE